MENVTSAPVETVEQKAPQAQPPVNSDQITAMIEEIARLKAEATDKEAKIAELSKPAIPAVVSEKPKEARKALPAVDKDAKVFGNKDEKQQYSFPVGWLGQVVVTQYFAATLPSGTIVPDEATRRTMPYDPDVFNKLEKTQGFEGFQYAILHDPR